MFVVVTGNAFDGQSIFGPFNDAEQANEWAENVQDDWWVVELLSPDPEG